MFWAGPGMRGSWGVPGNGAILLPDLGASLFSSDRWNHEHFLVLKSMLILTIQTLSKPFSLNVNNSRLERESFWGSRDKGSMWQTGGHKNAIAFLLQHITKVFITFCPRTRLLEDRMVNPSPGPSSEVEFEVPSLSLSFGLDCW